MLKKRQRSLAMDETVAYLENKLTNHIKFNFIHLRYLMGNYKSFTASFQEMFICMEKPGKFQQLSGNFLNKGVKIFIVNDI